MLGRPRSSAVDAAIKSATIEILAETGWHGLTMEAIAARAGVAKTTLYRRWADKDELVLDAVNELKGPVAVPLGQGLRADLVRVLDAMRRQWSDPLHGRIMRRFLIHGEENPEAYRSLHARCVQPRQEVFWQLLGDAVASGELRPDTDVELTISMLTAPVMVDALTYQAALGRAQIERIVDVVLAGLAG